MDTTGPIDSSGSKSVKRKFLQWTWRWFYANYNQDVQNKPDASELICLLQSIGFQLRQWEKSGNQDDQTPENSLRVILECGTSKMKATLELNDVNCKCPDTDNANDASIWSVSATAPTGSSDSINKFEDTGSNLLPKVSKESRLLIHDVMHRLINTINGNDVNQSQESNPDIMPPEIPNLSNELPNSFTRSRGKTESEIHSLKSRTDHTKNSVVGSRLSLADRSSTVTVDKLPEIVKTKPSPVEKPKRHSLQRQKTWDLIDIRNVDGEPRPSPPKFSNSPVAMRDLCTSLGQVSLQSDEENLSIFDCLRRAKYYISKAEMNVGFSQTPDQDNYLLAEEVFSKPAPPKRASTCLRISPTTTLRSSKPSTSLRASPTTSRSGSPSSNSSRLSTKSAVQKIPIRRSTGPPLYSPQPILKKTPVKLPLRGRSIGNPTPALKLAVATAQRNTGILKLSTPNRPTTGGIGNTRSSSSLTSNDTRKIASPFLNSGPLKAGISQLKTPGKRTLSTLSPLNITGNLTSTSKTPGEVAKPGIGGSGVPIVIKHISPTRLGPKKIGTVGTPRPGLPKK